MPKLTKRAIDAIKAAGWVQSCRHDLLDHVTAVDEEHLMRLLGDYLKYYHDDRTHLGLGKQTPGGRHRSEATSTVVAFPRLGGLHHRYDRAARVRRAHLHGFSFDASLSVCRFTPSADVLAVSIRSPTSVEHCAIGDNVN